ncbi:MAG: YtxH domain-containing protein [Muribaculaceae bacterium]|nr:YtxH domain-containing protein [Muribaculaceae bacterium]
MRELTIFVLGAVTGAVATALYTPVSGPELRARIRVQLQKRGIIEADKIDELVEYIAAKIEEEPAE